MVLADENMDDVLLYPAYASANRSLLNEITSLLNSDTHGKPIISCFPSPTGVWVEKRAGICPEWYSFLPDSRESSQSDGQLDKTRI